MEEITLSHGLKIMNVINFVINHGSKQKVSQKVKSIQSNIRVTRGKLDSLLVYNQHKMKRKAKVILIVAVKVMFVMIVKTLI